MLEPVLRLQMLDEITFHLEAAGAARYVAGVVVWLELVHFKFLHVGEFLVAVTAGETSQLSSSQSFVTLVDVMLQICLDIVSSAAASVRTSETVQHFLVFFLLFF